MSKIKTNDGIYLNYTDEGTGRPVVLLPGYGGMICTWDMQKEALLAKGYRVICLDRRSHGDSDTPVFGQRMARHGKDVDDLLNALELSDVTLVGHSMGASTVWAYVSLFGDGRLNSIISVDQTPKMLSDEKWPYGMYHLDFSTFPVFFNDPIPEGAVKPLNEELTAKMMAKLTERAFDLEVTFPLLLDHAFADWRDVIAQTKVKVLFIAGEKSPFWSCEHAAASAALCEKGSSEIIKDCGHVVPLEDPESLSRIIVEFLD